jgi:transcription termination factor Rho
MLRRALAGRDPKAALQGLIKLLEKEPSNDEVLRRLKTK